METLLIIGGLSLFILVLCGGYGAWMLVSYAVYKMRDKGNMTLREYSQDW